MRMTLLGDDRRLGWRLVRLIPLFVTVAALAGVARLVGYPPFLRKTPS